MTYTLPVLIISLGIIIAILHSYALAHHLYFSIWWFDLLVHFLSGMLIVLFSISILLQFYDPSLLGSPSYPLLLQAVLAAIIIGTVWETFELIFRLVLTDLLTYISDTASDMMMNIIGACAGYAFGIWHVRKRAAHG